MKKILIDTNFFMVPFTLKVDIFREIDRIIIDKYQSYIIDKTLEELNKILDTQTGKNKQAAKFAISLINVKKPHIIETKKEDLAKDVDTLIIELAKKEDYIIATQDALLKEKIKHLGRNCIIVRKKQYLMII